MGGVELMAIIFAWMSGHPHLACLVAAVAIIFLLWVLHFVAMALLSRPSRDRSGASLMAEDFSVNFDAEADQVGFTWTIANRGRFAARELGIGISFRAVQQDGSVALWRLKRTIAVLEPGEHVDVACAIARRELVRLAHDFDDGTIGLWSHYSSTPPGKTPVKFGATGPRVRLNLSVGKVGSEDCVTVTDLTPVAIRLG